MELDTGASVTIIPKSIWTDVLAAKPVERTDVRLRTYSGHATPVIGKAKVQVAYRDQEELCKFNFAVTLKFFSVDRFIHGIYLFAFGHNIFRNNGGRKIFGQAIDSKGIFKTIFKTRLFNSDVPKVHTSW